MSKPPGFDAGFDAGYWKGIEAGYARGWEDAVGGHGYHPNPWPWSRPAPMDYGTWLAAVDQAYMSRTGRAASPLASTFPFRGAFEAGMPPETFALVELPRMLAIAAAMSQ